MASVSRSRVSSFRVWMLVLILLEMGAWFLGSWPLACMVILLGVAVVSFGVAHPRSTLFGPLTCRLEKSGTVALTFDDGPDPEITPKILEILAQHGAKATFFVIGSQAKRYPDLITAIQAGGHSLGNHSYDHSASTNLKSYKACRQDFKTCEDTLREITNESIGLFRPPMGLKNPSVYKAVTDLGYRVITWSQTFSEKTQVKDRDILLFHDGYHLFAQRQPHHRTPELLSLALSQIEQRGWHTEVLT